MISLNELNELGRRLRGLADSLEADVERAADEPVGDECPEDFAEYFAEVVDSVAAWTFTRGADRFVFEAAEVCFRHFEVIRRGHELRSFVSYVANEVRKAYEDGK